MNAVGIGTTVGLATIIGLGLATPGAELSEYVITFSFYGFVSGLLFEAYRLAFSQKPPSR